MQEKIDALIQRGDAATQEDFELSAGYAGHLLKECSLALQRMSRTAKKRNRVLRKLGRRCNRLMRERDNANRPQRDCTRVGQREKPWWQKENSMIVETCIYCGGATEERTLEAKIILGESQFRGVEAVDYCTVCETFYRNLSADGPCCLEQAEKRLRHYLRNIGHPAAAAPKILDILRETGASLEYTIRKISRGKEILEV